MTYDLVADLQVVEAKYKLKACIEECQSVEHRDYNDWQRDGFTVG